MPAFFVVPGMMLIFLGIDDFYFLRPASIGWLNFFLGGWSILWSLLIFLLIHLLFLQRFFSEAISGQDFTKEVSYHNFEEWLIYSVFLVVSSLYLFESFPWVWLFSEGGAHRRLELTQFYKGSPYLRTLAFSLSNVVVLLFIIRRRYVDIKMFVVPLVSMMVLLSTGEKAPLLFLFISVGMVWVYKFGLNIKFIAKNFAFLLLTIATLYRIQMGSFHAFFSLAFERLFIAQLAAVFLSVRYYVEHDLIGFRSLSSRIFGWSASEQRVSEFFLNWFPGLKEVGTWNINGYYIHEAIGNFGIPGVFLSPFIAVFTSLLFYVIMTLVLSRSVGFIPLVFTFAIPINLLTSFNGILYNSNLLFTVVVIVLVHFTSKLLFRYSPYEK